MSFVCRTRNGIDIYASLLGNADLSTASHYPKSPKIDMVTPSPSLQSLVSPLLSDPTTKSWLFPKSPSPPLPPTKVFQGFPISIQQEALCNASTLSSGTNVEQLIIPSHHSQSLLYGYIYATGVKYSEAQRKRSRRQSSPHKLEARFCFDSRQREFVMVQGDTGRKGVLSFQRVPNASFKKCFFVVECDEGEVGNYISARCVVGESDERCDSHNDVSDTSRNVDETGEVQSQELRKDTAEADCVAESNPSLRAQVAELLTSIKGSFFSLSSTEHTLYGQTVSKREIGRELTIVGDVESMMVEELRQFAASLHYADCLSPRVEERMDIGVRRRLAAWRTLQRRKVREVAERWELRSLKQLKITLEGRYEAVKQEGEMLRLLLESKSSL